jgi:hypothetical protein
VSADYGTGVIFRKKPRIAVVNLLVALDAAAAAPVRDAAVGATRRIVDARGDFDVTKDAVDRMVRLLLEHADAWTHVASGGEIFDDAAAADAYGAECFADLSSRYLAGGDREAHPEAKAVRPGHERTVVMITLAYQGTCEPLEQPLADRLPLEEALRAVLALLAADRVDLAHLHVAPAHDGDHLDDERMLVGFPELLTL